MKKMIGKLVFLVIYGGLLLACKDIMAEGLKGGYPLIPAAVVTTVWWALCNRVPQQWPDLPDPAASFIRQTWKEQGYGRADLIIIKEIPSDSFYSKIVLYTQELPYGLAVGAPFKEKIERLLAKKERLLAVRAHFTTTQEWENYEEELEAVEAELQECRFVCGHERVHKEEWHTLYMLLIQLIAPLILDFFLKECADQIEGHYGHSEVARILRKKTVRSIGEMAVFWFSAHWFERRADTLASDDPEVIAAAIRLFERAKDHKEQTGSPGFRVKVLTWILKYTHPSTSERLAYLKKVLTQHS